MKDQAASLIDLLSKNGVDQVIAGDTHFFSEYVEPKHNLKMATIGAITADRNPQAPRLAIVDIYDDGSYNIEDMEIK